MRLLDVCHRSSVIVLLFCVALPLLASQPSQEPPEIVIDGSVVRVSRATPGERVVLYGISRETGSGNFVGRNYTIVRRAAADGIMTVDLKEPVPPDTVFAAVDYESGRHAMASPQGGVPYVVLPPESFRKRDGEYEFLDVETRWLEVLCVRPRKGAWQGFLTDGAGHDGDGRRNGRTLLDPAHMELIVGDDATPKKFRRGDVVIVIDPRRLRIRGTEVPE